MIPFAAPSLGKVDPAGGGGGVLSYKTNEGLAAVAMPSTGTTASATLTFSSSEQSVGATYLGIWGCDRTAINAVFNNVYLKKNGTTLETQGFSLQQSTPPDRAEFGGFFLHTGAASNDTYTLEGSVASGAGSSNAVNSRISLLKLGPNDLSAQDLTGTSTSSTTMVDALTLTVPSGGYDWLILASGLYSAASPQMRFELTDGTTTTGDIQMANARNTQGSGAPLMTGLYLPAYAGGTVRLKVRSNNASFSVTASRLRLVALRLDRFAHANVTRLTSDNSGTDTTYTAGLSQTFTPAAGDHLFIASAWLKGSSSSFSYQGKVVDGATDVAEMVRESLGAGQGQPSFGHRIVTRTASSITQSIQRLSETTSITTTIPAQSFVADLDLTGI